MSFKIALGEHASKAVASPNLVIDDHMFGSRTGDVWEQSQYSFEMPNEQRDKELALLRDKLDQVEDECVEVHTSLQGTFSLERVGPVINYLRHSGKKVTLVINPVGSDISSALGGEIPEIRFAGPTPFHEYDNPARSVDFFDQLRSLQEAVSAIQEELRKINDPEKLTTSIRATRAYLSSFEAFLDNSHGAAPDKVPEPVTRGLRDRLSSVNWASVSSQAQKWADTLIKLIDKLF